MNSRRAVKRDYSSPLRDAQAQATRLNVITAAGRLFVENGYGATSIEAIAQAAGVGRATVFTSVGGKPALLRTAYDVAIVGDDEPVPLPQRPWARRVLEATTQRERIDRYADMLVLVNSRVAGICEAFRGAASSDLDVRASWESIRSERRGGAANFVRFITDLGDLRPGLDAEHAADIVWLLNDPALYHQLVVERGWSEAHYRDWLSETMQAQLLSGRPGGARREGSTIRTRAQST
jgi:AcrR family transcriptional regulator